MRQPHARGKKAGYLLPLQLLAILLCSTFAIPAVASAAPSVTKTNVSFRGDGGLLLHGIIAAPVAPGRHPGLIMVGGSGVDTTDEFIRDSTAFAERGIVTLIYDKRTVGVSAFHVDYSVLANDAIGGVSLLRTQPNVNPALVGVYGLSEGGWVAPLAATRTNTIAYVITVGAAGVTPSRQQSWLYSEWLHHAGVSGSLVQMMRTSIRFGVGVGLYPEANYDGVTVWRHVHQPVLALWGSLDRHAVPAESSRIIAQALQQGNNGHYTIQIVPKASHGLNITPNDGFETHDTPLNPAYPNAVGLWVNNLAHGSSPIRVEGAQPEDVQSTPVTPLKWYESKWVQIADFFFMLLIFGSYPIVALVRRLRHRSAATPLRRQMRWLGGFGFVSVLGFFVYFAFLISTNASMIGPVILGSPIPWLMLRGLSLATVVAAAWTGVKWYRNRKKITAGRMQAGLLLASGVIFFAWATYWSMLIR